MMLRKAIYAAPVLGLCLAFGAPAPSMAAECLVPSPPGGGWDFTCRSIGKLLYDLKLVPQPVQIVNMPGATGAVAMGHVLGDRNDDPNLITATSTVGVTQIAQGRYPPGSEDVRWIAMLGADVGVVLVNTDSELQTLDDLLKTLKEDPQALSTGGSSPVGGWDHLRLLMMAKESGMPGEELRNIRWIQYDGGGHAVTQLLGGHVDVVTTDIGEIAGFIEAGDVRVLGVMSDERLPEPFADLPTVKEQGVDYSGYNWRGFYTGGEVSDEEYQGWVDTLQKLYDSPEWKEVAKQHGLTPVWRGGEEFTQFVQESLERTTEVSRDIGVIE